MCTTSIETLCPCCQHGPRWGFDVNSDLKCAPSTETLCYSKRTPKHFNGSLHRRCRFGPRCEPREIAAVLVLTACETWFVVSTVTTWEVVSTSGQFSSTSIVSIRAYEDESLALILRSSSCVIVGDYKTITNTLCRIIPKSMALRLRYSMCIQVRRYAVVEPTVWMYGERVVRARLLLQLESRNAFLCIRTNPRSRLEISPVIARSELR
jgi:hypothetical protein